MNVVDQARDCYIIYRASVLHHHTERDGATRLRYSGWVRTLIDGDDRQDVDPEVVAGVTVHRRWYGVSVDGERITVLIDGITCGGANVGVLAWHGRPTRCAGHRFTRQQRRDSRTSHSNTLVIHNGDVVQDHITGVRDSISPVDGVPLRYPRPRRGISILAVGRLLDVDVRRRVDRSSLLAHCPFFKPIIRQPR